MNILHTIVNWHTNMEKWQGGDIYVMESMFCMNTTTSVPKSVLRYDSLLLQYEILEKLVTLILELCNIPMYVCIAMSFKVS